MSVEAALRARSDGKCELCAVTGKLAVYHVLPSDDATVDVSVLLCATCREQIEEPDKIDVHHWHCLSESMWSQVPAVQVLAWRMLNHLSGETWARDLLDQMYLDEDTLAWAQAGAASSETVLEHRDSNGAVLAAGDTVILTKDLNVKGAGFTAKRGTAVRGISLVQDNAKHIEGRVNGQQIVILTEFVKKSA